MNQQDRSDKLISIIRNSRDLIKYIVSIEDDEIKKQKATMFLLMLESFQSLTIALVQNPDKEVEEEGFRMLDEAILKMESDIDDDFGTSKSPWYDPNNKGSA